MTRPVNLVVMHPRYGRVEYVPIEHDAPDPLMALRGGGVARRNAILGHAVARGWSTETAPGRGE